MRSWPPLPAPHGPPKGPMRTHATKRSELVVSPFGMWDGQWGRIQKSHAGCGRDSSVEPRNRNLTRSAKLRVSGKTKPHVDPKWKAPFLRITKTQTMSLKLERTPVFFASGRCGPVLTFAGARPGSSRPPQHLPIPHPLSPKPIFMLHVPNSLIPSCYKPKCIGLCRVDLVQRRHMLARDLHLLRLLSESHPSRGHSKDSKLIEDVGSMVYGCMDVFRTARSRCGSTSRRSHHIRRSK